MPAAVVAPPTEVVAREHAVTLELCRALRMSTRFVRAFTLRFAERSADNASVELPDLHAAIAATRDWRVIPFPPLPPAPLQGFPQDEVKPDLMIAGIGTGKRWLFQLIVEVKLTTPCEQRWLAGRRFAQPAVYAAVWDQIRPRDAADLRYVATVSPCDQPDWREQIASLGLVHVRAARDVCWVPELEVSVRQALSTMSVGERERFLPEVRHLLDDLNVAAPELGLRPPSRLRSLSVRRADRRRSRAATRDR